MRLAIKEFRKTRGGIPGGRPTPGAASPLRLYLDGVLIDLLNPKTAVFFLAFLPQFVDPSFAAAPQLAVLGLLFVVLAALIDGTYAVLAGRISHRLRTSRRAQHHLSMATGGVYLALSGVAVIS